MEPQNVCVRCCEPLGAKSRFNHVYWGMAHRTCPVDAVWPPRFRPSIDPNEVMKQIYALVQYLAKISTGLPISQILPNRSFGSSPHRVAIERPVMSVASPPVAVREEKDELGVDSTVTPPDDAPAKEASFRSPTTTKKRPQRPSTTSQATPSPKAKEAKQGERNDAPVAQQQPADKPNLPPPPPPSPKSSTKGSRKKSDTTGIIVTNQNTMREYNLQKAMQAVKGDFVPVDTDNEYNQRRRMSQGHNLELAKWGSSTDDWKCENCGEVTRRGDAGPGNFKCWENWEQRRFDVCFDCFPVVLRTEIT